ncbi:MAG: fasciclin domain-containing protein [Pseudomonadota bacterium]
MNGANVHIDGRNGVRVEQSNVIQADILASNGVIHVIDKVLIP